MYLLISVDVIQTSVDGTPSHMTAFYMECCPCPLHHVIYAPANVQRKKMHLQETILFDLHVGRMKYFLVSYASRDVCTCKV